MSFHVRAAVQYLRILRLALLEGDPWAWEEGDED